MLLAYLDESFTKHRYYICAVIAPESEVAPLSKALDAVVEKAHRAYETPARAELHGHALMHGKDDWECIAPMIRARGGIYDDAMSAIGQHDVSIVCRGMDVDRQKARYVHPAPPHGLVLQHAMERINEHAQARGEHVLLIADEVANKDGYRRDLWDYQQVGTPGYRPSNLKRIVDTLHFAPSDASRLLQAADLVAYMHCRRCTVKNPDARAKKLADLLWSRIARRIVHELCWEP